MDTAVQWQPFCIVESCLIWSQLLTLSEPKSVRPLFTLLLSQYW